MLKYFFYTMGIIMYYTYECKQRIHEKDVTIFIIIVKLLTTYAFELICGFIVLAYLTLLTSVTSNFVVILKW